MKILLVGAKGVGLEYAFYLAKKGTKVQILDGNPLVGESIANGTVRFVFEDDFAQAKPNISIDLIPDPDCIVVTVDSIGINESASRFDITANLETALAHISKMQIVCPVVLTAPNLPVDFVQNVAIPMFARSRMILHAPIYWTLGKVADYFSEERVVRVGGTLSEPTFIRTIFPNSTFQFYKSQSAVAARTNIERYRQILEAAMNHHLIKIREETMHANPGITAEEIFDIAPVLPNRKYLHDAIDLVDIPASQMATCHHVLSILETARETAAQGTYDRECVIPPNGSLVPISSEPDIMDEVLTRRRKLRPFIQIIPNTSDNTLMRKRHGNRFSF